MGKQERKSDLQTLQSRYVEFCVKEIHWPEQREQVLLELHGRDVLRGRVIDLSESGAGRVACAAVEVDGLSHPVIVPVAKVTTLET